MPDWEIEAPDAETMADGLVKMGLVTDKASWTSAGTITALLPDGSRIDALFYGQKILTRGAFGIDGREISPPVMAPGVYTSLRVTPASGREDTHVMGPLPATLTIRRIGDATYVAGANTPVWD